MEAGRTVFLKEKNGIRFYILSDSIENQYYGFSWCGPIYQDSQVCEIDYQYFKVNKDNTGSGFKSYYYANSIYKVRFMENGAAATDEWKRLD